MWDTYTVTLYSLKQAGIDLGLKDYPIFDETYREKLNNKIYEHYKFREIGFETPALFIDRLNQRMNEIMPLYNKYYKLENIKYNPLFNIDITETYEHQSSSTSSAENSSSSSASGTTKGKNVYSDLPETLVNAADVEGNLYASNAGIDKTESNNNGSSSGTAASNSTGTDKYTRHQEGSSAGLPFSKAVTLERASWVNVDMLIIKELSDLFINVW